tara:strand:+ start:668 stop:952 length:285 start_codon:yes stop_codon:yes gene_type:complete
MDLTPQISDYYNEYPKFMKIIEKMNLELAKEQEKNKILEEKNKSLEEKIDNFQGQLDCLEDEKDRMYLKGVEVGFIECGRGDLLGNDNFILRND